MTLSSRRLWRHTRKERVRIMAVGQSQVQGPHPGGGGGGGGGGVTIGVMGRDSQKPKLHQV